MRIHVVHPSELGPGEIESWHWMQQAAPSFAHPFLSPEFAMAAGRFRQGSRVAVLMDGQRTIGFFPFEKRRFGMGVPISGWLSACQGVVHAPCAQWEAGELLRGCRLSAWQFDNLIADQAPFKRFHSATAPSPIIDLAEGFDAYYAKLRVKAPRVCRELERKTRKLGREAGELRLECDSRDPALLGMLIAWKSEQYRRTNHVDRFDRHWVVGLLESVLATRAENLAGLLSVLYAGDQPVSIQFGLRSGSLLVGWFTGYDVRFSKYSPGLIQIRLMTEELAALGVNALHMGKGASRYTKAIKSGDIFVGEGTVTGQSLLGAAYRVRGATSRWALHTVRERPALHRAADQVLRRTGLSSHTYGRVLPYVPLSWCRPAQLHMTDRNHIADVIVTCIGPNPLVVARSGNLFR
jgi:CelD/BcsL family acetyltransferase involved in cellulose biosynthesis